jgi:hypothetical protein
METIIASFEKKQVERKPIGEVPLKKHIHVLPSGRRLKIVADDEVELKKVLLVLQS